MNIAVVRFTFVSSHLHHGATTTLSQAINVKFVVDILTLGHLVLRVCQFYPVSDTL